MDWHAIGLWLADFGAKHKESLGLFAIALIVTMRPKLPLPFSLIEPLEWCWEWAREALLTFISLRGPAQHSEAISKEQNVKKTIIEPDGKKTESVETQVTKGSENSQEPPKP